MAFLHHTEHPLNPYAGRLVLTVFVPFVLLHPIGFVLGFIMGWVWDTRLRPQLFYGYRYAQQTQNKSVALVRLAALVAKADGQITPAETEMFRAQVDVKLADMALVGLVFDQTRSQYADPALLAVDVREGCQTALEKTQIVRLLVRIAGCDGVVHPAQYTIIRIVAAVLEIPGATWEPWVGTVEEETRAQSAGEDVLAGASAYAVLGLQDGATKQEVKTRYRKLIRGCHPDKLKAEGADAVEIAAAEAEMVRLNEAYSQLMKQG